MRKALAAAVLGAVVAASCGGGGAPGEPLVSGSLTGDYKGQPFTPMFGFSTVYQGAQLLGVGDGALNCASPLQNDPPPGTSALFTVPALEVGTYSSQHVQIYRNVGSFEGTGSNMGTIEITAVNPTTVAGSVSYSYTDDEGQHYGLSGTFEVIRCAY